MTSQPPEAQTQRYPRSFQVVAKALGPVCNLDCTYCYYRHKEDWLPGTHTGHIADALLERFVQQFIAGQDEDPVVFNWHGGEPTLLGLDFFRKVVQLERQYGEGRRIENDFQTNGLLLDEAWCEFLKEHGFYVGLSLDGPKHLHDHYRKSRSGEPSFDRVWRAAKLLQQYGVPFNPLTVVNAVTAKHPVEVYEFLTEELGSTRLQWLPCVAHKDFRTTAPGHWDPARMPTIGTPAARPGSPESFVTEWSVDPDDWGEFLCRTFDLWLSKGIGRVMVNWFESLAGQWMGRRAHICTLAPKRNTNKGTGAYTGQAGMNAP